MVFGVHVDNDVIFVFIQALYRRAVNCVKTLPIFGGSFGELTSKLNQFMRSVLLQSNQETTTEYESSLICLESNQYVFCASFSGIIGILIVEVSICLQSLVFSDRSLIRQALSLGGVIRIVRASIPLLFADLS